MKASLTAAALACLTTAAALAQPATFGAVNLRAGFTPDPFRVSITSGGVLDASSIASGCRGWIANNMDYQVHYVAGTFNLSFSSTSNSDTTLMVRAPNGNLYCDDDSGNGLNPIVTIGNPQSGTYNVWVGSYQNGEYAQSTLSISELGRQ
ncbi:pre-peptidase C-terminal domain-containing protein [uncultured Maricaulis sp.]|uniref:pre-peptidase C-terminal domain-containing protein n=1 Tax=uncultured Maricaulis sp. TaxID=174710 RepID=UPI0030DDBE0B|tara:strand:- start:6870 stop:7319 length:450 start_codon:yes stop_codon:yes gene_type:complete